MKLYQINQQILDVLDTDTGEVLDIEAFEQLQIDKKEKVHSTAKYILHLDNKKQAIDNEIERLKELKNIANKKQEDLTKYLKRSMEIDNVTKYDFDTIKLSIRKNPPSLKFDDGIEESLEEYEVVECAKGTLKMLMSDLSNKKADIKKRLSEGEIIEGARLEQATRLDIK